MAFKADRPVLICRFRHVGVGDIARLDPSQNAQLPKPLNLAPNAW
jgi:hypothetical protein